MKRIMTFIVTALFALGLAGCDLLGGGGTVDCLENPEDPSCLPDDNIPVISLNGNATVNLMVGDTYTEAGALALDVEDGDISSSIVINSSAVNTAVAGTYTVTYNVTDSDGNAANQLTRTVIVTSDSIPVITLTGDAAVSLFTGSTWTDPGAIATDTEDGTLTVVVGGDTVDLSTAGVYTITYNVTDSDGNAAVEVTRVVTVSTPGAPVITLTGGSTINLVLGETWTDPGATAVDPEDGTLTVTIGGQTVNTAVAGTYTVTYDVTDSDGIAATQVTRTVVVAPNTLPVISLNGNATITITRGDTWTDPGVTANDTEDGDITTSVVTVDPVNPDVAGVYTITYNVTDSHGGAATQVTRTVTVELSLAEQAVVTYLENNWSEDSAPAFLGAVMMQMDFTNGQTFSTEIDFEITEDIDETHYIHAYLEDTYVYVHDDPLTTEIDESHNIMKRYVELDIDGEESFDFEIIFEEVETGVHVYLQPLHILDQLAEPGSEVFDIAAWIGFDQDWAIFKFDDSLQNVIEIQVLKDMLTSLFFAEMGDDFFTVAQDELEAEINIDLTPYGVDFGAIVDLLIDEEWTLLETNINSIDTEGIILEVDYQYIAWHLYEFLTEQTFHDLTTDPLFTVDLQLLNTAQYDELTEVLTVRSVADDRLADNVHGTQAFFDAMTEAELDILVENVLKPMLETQFYNMINHEINPDWLQGEMENILTEHQDNLLANWPEAGDPFDYATELALLQAEGVVEYWRNLTFDEQMTFWNIVDSNASGWVIFELMQIQENYYSYEWYKVHYDDIVDINAMTQGISDALQLTEVQTYMDTYYAEASYNQWIIDLQTEQVDRWYQDQSAYEQEALSMAIYESESALEYRWMMDKIVRINETPWQYQWMYVDYQGMAIHSDFITGMLDEMLTIHGQYILDNSVYAYTQQDIDDMITSIQTNGGFRWWMDSADEEVQELLAVIATFPGMEYAEWGIDALEEAYTHQSDFNLIYGRMEERISHDQISSDLSKFISSYQSHIAANYVDQNPGDWLDYIQTYNGLNFWYTLSPEQYQIFQDILDTIPGEEDSRWVVHFLLDSVDPVQSNEFGDVQCRDWNQQCIDEDALRATLIQFLLDNQDYIDNDMFLDTNNLINMINSNGPIRFWFDHLDDEQKDEFFMLAEDQYWQRGVLDKIDSIIQAELDFLGFIEEHETVLEAPELFNDTGLVEAWTLYINTNGFQDFMQNELSAEEIEILADAYVYPFLEDLYTALDLENIDSETFDPELLEFILDTFFMNPHVVPQWDGLQPEELIATNLMAIDWDMFLKELEAGAIDPEAFFTAVHDGQTAFDAYVSALALVDLNDDPVLELFPDNVVLFLEILSPAVLELEPYMTYVDDLIYAYEGLSEFEQYLDITYYINDTMMDMDAYVTDDFFVQVDMEMTNIAYQIMVGDLLDSLYIYLDGFENLPLPFDEDFECITDPLDPNYDPECACDPLDTNCQELDDHISNIMAILTQMGDLGLSVVFDPNDMTWMEFTLDLTDALDTIVGGSYMDYVANTPGFTPNAENDIWTGVNNLTIVITMDEEATIDIPIETETDDVNAIAEDMAKFATSMFARDIIRDIIWAAEDSGDVQTFMTTYAGQNSLDEFDIYVNPAFDPELSTLYLGFDILNMKPIIELDLYWIDGTQVFTEELTWEDLEPLFDSENDLVGPASFTTMVGWVDDTNFHMTKLFLMLLWQDNNDYDDEDMGMYN